MPHLPLLVHLSHTYESHLPAVPATWKTTTPTTLQEPHRVVPFSYVVAYDGMTVHWENVIIFFSVEGTVQGQKAKIATKTKT